MDCKNGCDELKNYSSLQNEFILRMSEIMEKLDESQLMVEGNAFDAINSTDRVLNLVKNGIESVDTLITQVTAMNRKIEEVHVKIQELNQCSLLVSELSKKVGGISNRITGITRNITIQSMKDENNTDSFVGISSEMNNLSLQASLCSNEMDETVQAINLYLDNSTEIIDCMLGMTVEENTSMREVRDVLHQVIEASHIANDVSRNMEHEIAYQRDITDSVTKAIEDITSKAVEQRLS